MTELQPGEFKTTLNGVDLWYRVSGSGPVCLIPSPPWGPSSDYLFRSLEPLDELFTMVYLDSRGTGRSGRPEAPEAYVWAELTADLEALRRHLQQERVWLMGHSMAGVQVMQYILAHPEPVEGLILLDTIPAVDQEHQDDVTARRQARRHESWYPEAARAFEIQPQTSAQFEQKLLTILPFYFVDQANIDRAGPAFQLTTYSFHAWQRAGQRHPFSLLDRLPEIQAPTLIVVGAGDFICSAREAQRLHLGIPNSKLLVIEAAGHFPWMEQPDAFYDGLRRFLPTRGYRPRSEKGDLDERHPDFASGIPPRLVGSPSGSGRGHSSAYPA